MRGYAVEREREREKSQPQQAAFERINTSTQYTGVDTIKLISRLPYYIADTISHQHLNTVSGCIRVSILHSFYQDSLKSVLINTSIAFRGRTP